MNLISYCFVTKFVFCSLLFFDKKFFFLYATRFAFSVVLVNFCLNVSVFGGRISNFLVNPLCFLFLTFCWRTSVNCLCFRNYVSIS